MIKVFVHLAKIIIAAAAALFFFSCNMQSVDGSGNVTTQSRPVTGEFTSITASNALEVYIEQGVNRSVTVEADDNLQGHIKVEASGTELKISSDVNIGSASAKKITIVLPEVKGIEASGATMVKSKTILKSDYIKLTSSGAADMEVTVIAKKVTAESSGAGKLKVTGSADRLDAEASGAGIINAKELAAKDVNAEASGAGTIHANPTASLKAQATSGSNIYYVAPAKKMDTKTDSGGTIAQE